MATKQQNNHTVEEVEGIRKALKYGIRDLSRALNMPLRTVESYFYGERTIPQEFVDRLLDLQQKDRDFFVKIRVDLDKYLDDQFGPGKRILA